jgi:glucan 1,3-beta-glucosidase
MSRGWIYWTAKTERHEGLDAVWDMKLLIDHGVFPQPFTDRKYTSGCANLVKPPDCEA